MKILRRLMIETTEQLKENDLIIIKKQGYENNDLLY
jgi:hypothetical protein